MSLPYKSKIIVPIAATVLLLDRLTKQMITDRFSLEDCQPVMDGFFNLTYVRNTGAAFGVLAMLDDTYRVPFFAATTLAAVGLLLYFIWRAKATDILLLVSLALIIGGALGNLFDRLMYGYVVDFIDWYHGSYHWPAFNVADSAISVGMVILGEEIIIRKKL